MKTLILITGLISMLYNFFGEDLAKANLESKQIAVTVSK